MYVYKFIIHTNTHIPISKFTIIISDQTISIILRIKIPLHKIL